jgi:hypothetical protein
MMNRNPEKPLSVRFIDDEADVRMELSNDSDYALKSVEILTVFLKNIDVNQPSQAHIRFAEVSSISANQNVIVSHKTWVNGRIADAGADLLANLKMVAGTANPYVLDISWQNSEGKTRFQRIPVGH